MTKTTDKEKIIIYQWASLVAQWYTISLQGRNHSRLRFDPQVGKIPKGGNGNHCSILAWRIPWTEEPRGLQSMVSQSQT